MNDTPDHDFVQGEPQPEDKVAASARASAVSNPQADPEVQDQHAAEGQNILQFQSALARLQLADADGWGTEQLARLAEELAPTFAAATAGSQASS